MKPKFGNALLADFARPQPNGKIDATGIFTSFNAWGYPSLRSWTLLMSIYDIPEGRINVHIGLKRQGNRDLETIAAIDVTGSSQKGNQVIIIPLNYRFLHEGSYSILCSIKDFSSKLAVPFEINSMIWPEFTTEEIEFVLKYKKFIPYKLTAQINCLSCSHAYIFEESILLDEAPQGGTIRFPEDGIFECTKCGHEMNLKDIQGQLRASLKENLSNLLKRIPYV